MAEGGSLEIRQDLAFQRRWAAVQRVGRLVFVVGFAAALAGISGTGPLAHATASAPTFSVDYDRFLRSTQSSALQVSPSTQQGGGGAIREDDAVALGGLAIGLRRDVGDVDRVGVALRDGYAVLERNGSISVIPQS